MTASVHRGNAPHVLHAHFDVGVVDGANVGKEPCHHLWLCRLTVSVAIGDSWTKSKVYYKVSSSFSLQVSFPLLFAFSFYPLTSCYIDMSWHSS